MKLWVYSENLIRAVAPHDEPHAIISIYTPGGSPARFRRGTETRAVLFLAFPDLSYGYMTEVPTEKKIYTDDQLFNAEHANKILDFVELHKGAVEAILCQCEGGLSRSVAVKAALDTLLNEDVTPFDGTNMLVYDTLLKTAAARAKR